jgi:hypothetical protein
MDEDRGILQRTNFLCALLGVFFVGVGGVTERWPIVMLGVGFSTSSLIHGVALRLLLHKPSRPVRDA